NENAFFGDVGNVNSKSSAIKNVTECHVHTAFRRKANAGLRPYFVKADTVVEVELGYAIVIGDEQIRMPGPAKARGARRKRPATAIDAEFFTDLLEPSVAEIVEQVFSTAVLRVFEALRHDFRGGQM